MPDNEIIMEEEKEASSANTIMGDAGEIAAAAEESREATAEENFEHTEINEETTSGEGNVEEKDCPGQKDALMTIATAITELSDTFSKHDVYTRTIFERKILADAQKDKVIDNFHHELQEYKGDLYAKLTKPLLMDLIQLKEDMHKEQRRIALKSEDTETAEILDSFCLDIGDILEKYNVEGYKCETEEYMPIKQRIIKTVETDAEGKDRHIAQSLSYGYTMGDKVLTPERVTVYTYKKQAAEKES